MDRESLRLLLAQGLTVEKIAGGLTLSADAVRAEVVTCVLLCSNCHAEVESGVSVVPVE